MFSGETGRKRLSYFIEICGRMLTSRMRYLKCRKKEKRLAFQKEKRKKYFEISGESVYNIRVYA